MPQSDYPLLGAEIARARKRFSTLYIFVYITQNCGINNNYVLQLKVSCSVIMF